MHAVLAAAKSAAAKSSAAAMAVAPGQEVHHIVRYDSGAHPVPAVIEQRRADTGALPDGALEPMPRRPYARRAHEIKTAVHLGQRKLLLSEVQLLGTGYAAGHERSYLVVYAGSAPGEHLPFLDSLFPGRHEWLLVDPGAFVPAVHAMPNATVLNDFFTNAVAYRINVKRMLHGGCPALAAAYEWATRCCENAATVVGAPVEAPAAEQVAAAARAAVASHIGQLDVARQTDDIPTMLEPLAPGLGGGLRLLCEAAAERRGTLFVSDIRTGTVAKSNFDEHVAENMLAQQRWTEIIRPDFALLKYRLPYSGAAAAPAAGDDRGDGRGRRCVTQYLEGDVLCPLWGAQTTTEGRLVVPRGGRQVPVDALAYEERMMFFNSVLRERVHFTHPLIRSPELDAHYDSAAEAALWLDFVRRRRRTAAAAAAAAGGGGLSAELTETEACEEAAALAAAATAALGETVAAGRRRNLALVRQPGRGKRERGGQAVVEQQAATKQIPHWLITATVRERGRAVWWAPLPAGSVDPEAACTVWRCQELRKQPPLS